MWIRNYKHSEDLVRWWLFFPKALAFVISTPFVFRKGYFQMVLPSFVTLPFHPPPSPPFETPFKFLRRLRVFKCYYVWCRFCIQYLCQRHEEWQDLFRFCFHCCKDLHHFFSEAIGDPLMCVITLATMCILFLSEVRHRTFLLTSVQSQNNAICLQLDALSGSLRQNNHVGLMLFFKNVFRNLFMD